MRKTCNEQRNRWGRYLVLVDSFHKYSTLTSDVVILLGCSAPTPHPHNSSSFQADAPFAASTLAVTFPYSLIAAGSWWHYDASIDPASREFRARLLMLEA